MKKLLVILSFICSTQLLVGQTLNVQNNVTATGRFSSCNGPTTPTVTATFLSGNGTSVQNGNLVCTDPCGTTTLQVNISGIRWNQSPGSEWIHGIFLPANAGYTLSGINLPAGFITYNPGCTGQCPVGITAGPGFYFDATAQQSCCAGGTLNDNLPCNNFGAAALDCGTNFALDFNITFCNSQLTGSSETFTLTGTSDGATGCWTIYNTQFNNTIGFTINTVPCSPIIGTPLAAGPIERDCDASNIPNYTTTLTGGCGNSSTITWWDAPTGGTQLGSGSPFVYDPPGSACPGGTTVYASCCPAGSTVCLAREALVISGNCLPLTLTAIDTTQDVCDQTFSINAVTVNNPVGTVNYTLNPGSISNNSGAFPNLNAGTYTVVATDAGGCSVSTVITYNPPNVVTITNATSTQSSCVPGNDGTITISANQGTPVYQYNIGGADQTNNVFNNVGAGTYTVTVTDANGCTATSTITVSSPNAPSINTVTTTAISCVGLNDGGIAVTSTGGTTPLSYNLQPNNTTNTNGQFSNLSANAYSITVTDANGCTISTVVNLQDPPAINFGTPTTTNVLCNGGTSGSLSISATGGTGAISYTLQPSNQSNSSGTFNNLGANIYTVTAADANACFATTIISITEPAILNWTNTAFTNVNCNGGNDGSITAVATGGTGTILYSANPGNLTSAAGNFINLVIGNYTITATDANNCTLTTIISITEPTAVSIASITNTMPSCVPGNDATLTVTASGGTAPYQYNIGSLNQSSNVFNNVGAGTYTITVTDANNCTITSVHSVVAPNSPTWNSVANTNVSCNGGNDASITSSASGGTGSLNYVLNPGSISNTTGNYTNLSQGGYTITVTDANGCTVTTAVAITEPSAIIFGLITTSNVTCNSGNDGSFSASATGGTGTLSYTMQPGNSTNTTGSYSNLSVGGYTVTVTDANNCTATTIVNITEPSPVVWNAVGVGNINCNGGNTGSINSIASGGTGLINYTLQPTNTNNITGSFTNLTAGSYTITAADANNCTISTVATISEPPALVLSNVSSTIPSCVPGNDATITISAVGGTGVLQYDIGGTSQLANVFNNVSTGSYTITVTDANNCTISSIHIVIAPNQPVLNAVSGTNILCNGDATGSITSSATGGTGTLTYLLQPGNNSNTTGIFNNLTANIYTLSVTDINGCDTTTIINITEPPALTWDVTSSTNISCFAANDGSINATALGGTPAINYTLMPGNVTNTSGSFVNLSSGNYTVSGVDANNCSITTTFIIMEPPLLQITSVTNTIPTCVPGNDATITIIATGGTPLYQYNNGGANQSSNSINNVGAGSFVITVTDANGCTATSNLTITNPNSPQWTQANATDVNCNGGIDGSITSNAIGGTGAISYLLQPSNTTNTSGTFNGLGANTYTVNAIDAIGCSASTTLVINEPPAILWDLPTIINVSCNGFNDGSIQQTANGGTGGLSYNLQPGNVNNLTGSFSNLIAGIYTITVTDANNCTNTVALAITEPQVLAWNNVTLTNVNCAGGDDGALSVGLVGGTPIYSFTLLPGNINNTSGTFTNLLAGSYTVNAVDASNCTQSTVVIITEPNALNITSTNNTNVTCSGASDGSITILAAGGATPLNYSLQPINQSNTTGQFTALPGNNYTIIITDANNCSISTQISVIEPQPLLVDSLVVQDVLCNGNNNGSISFYASGGTTAYSFNMMPGNITNATGVFNNLSPNTYTITNTDANGCTISSVANVIEPSLLKWFNTTAVDILCAGETNGTISASATGGVPSITYNLVPGNINSASGSFINLPANTYTITAIDANNCTISTVLVISEPPAIVSSFISTDVSCFGEDDGTITVSTNGGVSPYSYTLYPTNTTNTTGGYSNLLAGTYTVVITDSNACIDSILNAIVIEPAQIQFTNIVTQDISCFGDASGEISLQATGGNSALSFTIVPNFGSQSSVGNFQNLTAGTYTIYATDNNGCSDSTTITLNQNPAIRFTAINITEPRCYGESNGTIIANAIGGFGTLQYTLNQGAPNGTGNFGNLSANNYLLRVTDDLGCTRDTLIVLDEPAQLLFGNLDITNVSCVTKTDGIIKAQASGGNGDYTYYIRPGINLNRSGVFNQLAIGTYTISVRDTLGCQADTTAFVGLPDEVLTLEIDKKDLGCYGYGNEGWAEAVVTGGFPPYTFLWSTNPTQIDARAVNLYFGFYNVSVTDAKGCEVRDSIYIEPGPCCDQVFFPNAFTPNGDGQNDYFRMLTSAGIKLKQLEVYNRWGQRIWSTTNFRDRWDGTFQGEPVDLGTYFYVFAYTCLTDGRDYSKRGDITLIR